MVIERAKEVLRIEAEAIGALIDRIGKSFSLAVEIILKSEGRVVVTGVGKSGHIGRKIAATLASTGTPSFFLHPVEGRHGDLGMVT
ncbi:SIS domain-containing protein, partial [candidate division NPL-UPA2 bacterium]|nr:SIS domain-containing protein [candidate division NPL-UPA2 bacterium]